MTLLKALEEANKIRPNAANDDIKAPQLFQGLEAEVAELLGEAIPDNPFPDDVELLMPYPYDDIYRAYLCAQIDLMNEETQLYAVDMEVFNAAWARAQAWYRRNFRSMVRDNWRVM